MHISEAQHLLTRYCESHGRYPSSLADALPASRSDWATTYDFDAWGRALLYTSSGAEYELRSAGADGHGSTADDLVGTAERLLVPDALAPELQQHNPCAQR
ncbi:MAG: type II secretion system protein GspG [Gemmatimonadetes bacterium]|nr:type II secretion system protein GspG [Gemmatimonadota bacterium]